MIFYPVKCGFISGFLNRKFYETKKIAKKKKKKMVPGKADLYLKNNKYQTYSRHGLFLKYIP